MANCLQKMSGWHPSPQPDRTNTSSKLMNMDQLFLIEILPYSELRADTFLDINISSSGRIALEVSSHSMV